MALSFLLLNTTGEKMTSVFLLTNTRRLKQTEEWHFFFAFLFLPSETVDEKSPIRQYLMHFSRKNRTERINSRRRRHHQTYSSSCVALLQRDSLPPIAMETQDHSRSLHSLSDVCNVDRRRTMSTLFFIEKCSE